MRYPFEPVLGVKEKPSWNFDLGVIADDDLQGSLYFIRTGEFPTNAEFANDLLDREKISSEELRCLEIAALYGNGWFFDSDRQPSTGKDKGGIPQESVDIESCEAGIVKLYQTFKEKNLCMLGHIFYGYKFDRAEPAVQSARLVAKFDGDTRKNWDFCASKMSARDFNRCLYHVYGNLIGSAEDVPNDDPFDPDYWKGTGELKTIEIAALFAHGILQVGQVPVHPADTDDLPVYVDLFEFLGDEGELDLEGEYYTYKLDQLAPILIKYDFIIDPPPVKTFVHAIAKDVMLQIAQQYQ